MPYYLKGKTKHLPKHPLRSQTESLVYHNPKRELLPMLQELSKAESKYETTRKKLLAMVFGLKQCRQYLLGRHFVIRTDHAALSWLRRTPEPMPQLARWLPFIEQFDYEVVHRDGARHRNADGLSRRPPEADKSTEDTKDDEADEAPEADVRVVTQERSASVLVRENFAQLQQNDTELGATVRFSLAANEAPTNDELQTETELTKKMMTKWDEL